MESLIEDLDFTPFGIDELRGVGLGILLPALIEMGYTSAEVQGAKFDTVVGIFWMAQYQHPEIAYKVWQKTVDIRERRAQVIRGRSNEVKKPRQRSNVHGAVGQVHKICERMKGQPRKDVIAECVKHGINENTAKTQYYKWAKGQGN